MVAKRLIAAAIVAAVAITGPPKGGRHVLQDVASGFSRTLDAQALEPPASPRARTPVTFLQINDVYSTVPIDGAGGLARVATIRRQLADAGRTPFLVLAGDFLSPSVSSTVFKGAHMVAALNAAGLDMATLGNHEFDFGDDVLIERMREAKWQWVVSNVVDTRTGRPIADAAPYVVKTFGALKVGFIGLCLNTVEIRLDKLTHTRIDDPLEAAARYLPRLKAEGAAVIVAVTHLVFATDRALVERFPEIDLVIGGHEHYLITSTENRALVSKAGTDARNVARIDVNRRPEGTIERFYELLPVTSAIADDTTTADVVAAALENGVSRYPATAGQFPQVSGLTFAIDSTAPAGRRVAGVQVNGRPLDPEKVYTLAISDFMFKGGDGYTMFPGGQVLVSPEAGDLIADALEKYIAGKKEVAPQIEGRIKVR